MDVAIRIPGMTREAFLDWAEAQDEPYEFDGFQPVALTGGSLNHDQMTANLSEALRIRLRGSPCRPFGPNAGVATIGDAVRYPDALVTCGQIDGTSRLVPGDWIATALTSEDILDLPDVGITIAVIDLYEGVDLPRTDP